MKSLPKSANRLIQEFSNLPGIGRKTAQRLTFHILKSDAESVSELSKALIHVKEKVHNCTICNGITEQSICSICEDADRDENIICVVENSYDISINVTGGGLSGQAGAIRLGIARALNTINEDYRKIIKQKGFLTRDARKVERKKPGQPGARKNFQFSKR